MRTPTEVVASVSWLKGPSAAGSVYFSDVKANRLYHRAPDGAPIGFIPIGEDSVTNITQSIVDAREFFVTSGKRLFSIRPFERPLQMRSS